MNRHSKTLQNHLLNLISLKRLWIMRPRSIKPAMVAFSLVAITLMFNSLLLIGRRAPQGMLDDFVTISGSSLSPKPIHSSVLPRSPTPSAATTHQYWSPMSTKGDSKSPGSSGNSFPAKVKDEEQGPQSQKTATAVPSDFFYPMKGKVVYNKMKGNEIKPGYINNGHHDDSRPPGKSNSSQRPQEKNMKRLKEEPSFGYVNQNFKPPDLSPPGLNSWVRLLQNFSQGDLGINPGTVLGAVVGLSNYNPSEIQSPLNPQVFGDLKEFHEKNKTLDTEGQVRMDQVMTSKDTELRNKDFQTIERISGRLPVPSNSPNRQANLSEKEASALQGSKDQNRQPKERNGGQSAIGSLISQFGPLVSAAFTNNDDSQNSKINPLLSVMGALGPLLLSGSLTEGADDRKTAHNQGVSSNRKPNLFQSLAGVAGPALVDSILGNGMSPDAAESPVQSILKGIGPVLLGGAMDTMFNTDGSQVNRNGSPVQSILSGIAPLLMAGALGNGLGNSNSQKSSATSDASPLQSLVSKLGPAILAGALNQNFGSQSSDTPRGGSSGLGGILAGLAPLLMGKPSIGRSQSRRQPRLEGNPVTHEKIPSLHHSSREVLMSRKRDADELESSWTQREHLVPQANSRTKNGGQTNLSIEYQNQWNSSSEMTDRISTTASVPDWMAKSLARTVVRSVGLVLPERLPVAEANSTRGLWDMALNLVLGNPKVESGRKSQFWKWLREFAGGVPPDEGPSRDSPETPLPSWISRSLEDPQRAKYREDIRRFYRLMTDVQPSCKNVAGVGGTYNWKKNIIENEMTVCLDDDVSPRKRDCLVYSFGLQDNDWSFEEEMEKMGCEVWVFDPVLTTGDHNHSKFIHFYNVGLSDRNTSSLVNGRVINFFTLSSVLGYLGHERLNVAYLKLDLGGQEWQVLQQITDKTPHVFSNVKQMSLEVHLHRALKEPSLYKAYTEVLLALESLGFQLFSAKPKRNNNFFFFDPLLGEKDPVSLVYQLVYIRI